MKLYFPSAEALLADPWITFCGFMFATSSLVAVFIGLVPMTRAFNRGDERKGMKYFGLVVFLLTAGMIFGDLGIDRMDTPEPGNIQIEPPEEIQKTPPSPKTEPLVRVT